MEKLFSILQVIIPIFLAVALGMFSRKKAVFSSEEVQGIQKFIVKVCLPFLLFRSCLTVDLGSHTGSNMVLLTPFLLLPFLLFSTFWAFRRGRKRFPYHNLPMLLCCKETGMIGLPLFMILFGADTAFYLGVLDLAQAPVSYSIMGVLSAGEGNSVSKKEILKEIFRSPLILLSLLGVALNLTGIWDLVVAAGAGGMVTEILDFLSQPVSMVMLFCVGYYFSLSSESRGPVLKIAAVHFGFFAVMAVLLQILLGLLPGVHTLTRWAMLFYCLLPSSYLAPGLGRSEEDFTAASGVCSVLTIICMIAFACMAAIVA